MMLLYTRSLKSPDAENQISAPAKCPTKGMTIAVHERDRRPT